MDSIKEELKKHKLSDNLQEILVPTHEVTEVKKEKELKEKKVFSGICFSQNRVNKTNLSLN